MLKENLQAIRKSKGLSQQELAVKLNVVRQTISKWEKGLSVPDSEMLVKISEVFEIPAGDLLSETAVYPEAEPLKAIAEKIEVINLQMERRSENQRKTVHFLFITVSLAFLSLLVFLYFYNSAYLNWDYSDLQTAILGTAAHSIEWLFVRAAPILLIILFIGIYLTRKKR